MTAGGRPPDLLPQAVVDHPPPYYSPTLIDSNRTTSVNNAIMWSFCRISSTCRSASAMCSFAERPSS